MDLSIKNIISMQLKKACYMRRKTAKELANDVGIGYTTFNTYVNGKSEPKAGFFLLMHKAGFNVTWLLTGEGEMYRSDSEAKPQQTEVESTFPAAVPISRQEKLIKNHRKAKISAFIEYWFATKTMDEQAWLEVQLRLSLPQYADFVNSKEMEEKLRDGQVG